MIPKLEVLKEKNEVIGLMFSTQGESQMSDRFLRALDKRLHEKPDVIQIEEGGLRIVVPIEGWPPFDYFFKLTKEEETQLKKIIRGLGVKYLGEYTLERPAWYSFKLNFIPTKDKAESKNIKYKRNILPEIDYTSKK